MPYSNKTGIFFETRVFRPPPQSVSQDSVSLSPPANPERCTACSLTDLCRQLVIFYRLLRPEFVRDRGRTALDRLKVSPDHEFPAVEVPNPMRVALLACAKFAKGRQKARARTASSMDGTPGSAGKENSSGGVGQRRGGAELGDESTQEGNQDTVGDRADEPFEPKGEHYFEGFAEEDEEELMRRGGMGHPRCYDSITSDDPAGLDGSEGDDGDSDGGESEWNDRASSPGVHGSVVRPEISNAAVAVSSAENNHTGSSALTSVGRLGVWVGAWWRRAVERAGDMVSHQ